VKTKMINRLSKMLMVTGLARSGTTLLAECLNHHPQVMCIADPMNEFFKGFLRYAYYNIENEKKSVKYPIDNFFFSGSKKVSQFLDKTDLNHKIPDYLREEILERIALRDSNYCPEIKEPIKKCQAKTFDSLFLEIINLLYSFYGKPKTECFGIKTVWCEQFIPLLARTFPNMYFVNILRDPRAIISSNYILKENRYPLYFNIRDWRKSTYHSWKFKSKDPLISSKFTSLKYEDIIDQAEDSLRKITNLLGIEYDKKIVEQPFKKPNTSYQNQDVKDSGGISTKFKEKWKQVLPKEIILQIEKCCQEEMKRLNYELRYPNEKTELNSLTPEGNVSYETLSGWCREMIRSKEDYKTWLVINDLLEKIRLTLIGSPNRLENKQLIKDFFYEERYYLWLRDKK